MTIELRDDSCLRANDRDVAAKVVDGEAILINLNTGVYYSMADVAGFVWSLLEKGASVDQVATAVATRYSVPAAQVKDDIRRLLRELLAESLVVLADGSPAPGVPGATEAKSPGSYAPPTLTRFEDMADMFALDPPLPELPPVPSQH